jgi:Starch-binding associating with outer membrane
MKNKILSVLIAAVLATSACSDITDINVNPNGPVTVPPPSIVPSALQTLLTNGIFNTGMNVRYGGLWVQHFSEIQYRDEDKYIVRPGVTGGWGFYTNSLEDFQQMIDQGIDQAVPNWEAVGRIMKSYTFSVMTEAMGDLPYSDALKGDEQLQPTYDTQPSIYNSLFSELTTAAQLIDPSGVGFSTGDLVYDGDMAKWRRLANSLRLRLAIHIQKADASKAASEAAAAVAAGVFTSAADNAGLSYLTQGPNQNPIYTNHLSRDDYGMSQTLVDSMKLWNDPRLPVYAQPNTAADEYVGLENGLNDGAGPPLNTISRYGAYWREQPAADMFFITYAEVLLLQAEAAERGWISGNAATLYSDAIRASMEQHGVADADINTYLALPQVQYAGGAAGLSQIAYEYWISLYMNGMEAWTQWRRTQVPGLLPGPNAVKNAGVLNGIPERLPYDDQELVLNAANVQAAVSAQGFPASNDLWTPLWFTGR